MVIAVISKLCHCAEQKPQETDEQTERNRSGREEVSDHHQPLHAHKKAETIL